MRNSPRRRSRRRWGSRRCTSPAWSARRCATYSRFFRTEAVVGRRETVVPARSKSGLSLSELPTSDCRLPSSDYRLLRERGVLDAEDTFEAGDLKEALDLAVGIHQAHLAALL